jgi:hypothetical protein
MLRHTRALMTPADRSMPYLERQLSELTRRVAKLEGRPGECSAGKAIDEISDPDLKGVAQFMRAAAAIFPGMTPDVNGNAGGRAKK